MKILNLLKLNGFYVPIKIYWNDNKAGSAFTLNEIKDVFGDDVNFKIYEIKEEKKDDT